MLTRIEIDGFKSFTNFAMDFSPLTVIAGLNASGKSNLFDALHLLSLLAEKPLAEAFNEVQRGRNLELFTQYADGRVAEEMRFAVGIADNVEVLVEEQYNTVDSVEIKYELIIRRRTDENYVESLVVVGEILNGMELLLGRDEQILHVSSQKERSQDQIGREEMPLGGRIKTALSAVQSMNKRPVLFAVRKEISSWRLLHLDPNKIPNPSPAQAFGLPGPLNASADNLAAVLWRISKTDDYLLARIAQRLTSLVPGIKEIVVENDAQFRRYVVSVITTAAQKFPLHLLSEGTLRMLALCTLVFDPEQKGLVGLEEVENGVHPARLKDIAALLRDLSTDPTDPDPGPLRQVIVNTHSPGLVKACLEAVAGQEGGASGLTVWFSQLVSRPVEEDGKRTTRRVTHMLPVSLDADAAKSEDAQKRMGLYQLVSYLESANPDDLLDSLGLQSIADAL